MLGSKTRLCRNPLSKKQSSCNYQRPRTITWLEVASFLSAKKSSLFVTVQCWLARLARFTQHAKHQQCDWAALLLTNNHQKVFSPLSSHCALENSISSAVSAFIFYFNGVRRWRKKHLKTSFRPTASHGFNDIIAVQYTLAYHVFLAAFPLTCANAQDQQIICALKSHSRALATIQI